MVRERLFRELAPQLMELPREIGRKRLQMRLVYVSTKLEYSPSMRMKYLYHSASRNCDQGAGGAKISVLDLGVIALLCRAGSRLEALLAERGRLEQQSKPFTMLEGVSLPFAFRVSDGRWPCLSGRVRAACQWWNWSMSR